MLQVIKDILTEKKGVIAPPFNEEGQLVTVDTEEKIYRELYDTVKAQLERDRVYLLNRVDYVKFYAHYCLIIAYKTIMEIGGIKHRLQFHEHVKKFIDSILQQVKDNHYTGPLDLARLFAYVINLEHIKRFYI